MKKVLIAGGASDQAYAPAIGALTAANGALTPDLLASGGLAVYGFVDVVSGSLNAGTLGKEILINNSATNNANTGDVDDFVAGGANDTITISQGGLVTPVNIFAINRKGVTRIVKQDYVEPVKELSFIGFNGVNGSINMPTITQGSEAGILAIQKEATTADKIRSQEDYVVGNLASSDTEYGVLSGIVSAFNNAITKTHTAFIKANGTYTVAAGTTGTATLTKGSNQLVFATALPTNWAVGDYIALGFNPTTNTVSLAITAVNGIVFRIASISGTTITLDRPFIGETVTISQTNFALWAAKVTSSITAWGIGLQVNDATRIYNYAIQGLLQNASLTSYYAGVTAGTQTTFPTKGLGTGAAVVAIEEGLIAYRGQLDSIDKRMKTLPRYANAATNYVAYSISFRVTTETTGAPHNKGENSTVLIFVPTTQTSMITLFEAILKKLCTNASVNF